MSPGSPASAEPPCIASSSSIGRLAAWTPCCPGAPVGAEEPASSPVKSRRPSVRRSKRIRLAKPQPTLTHVVEQVHARCLECNLPLPHRRTIQARLATAAQREREEG